MGAFFFACSSDVECLMETMYLIKKTSVTYFSDKTKVLKR
jgi:hypothetical protein